MFTKKEAVKKAPDPLCGKTLLGRVNIKQSAPPIVVTEVMTAKMRMVMIIEFIVLLWSSKHWCVLHLKCFKVFWLTTLETSRSQLR